MRRTILLPAGVVLAAASSALAEGLVLGGEKQGPLPFTVGPATTVVEILDPQGLPDYVAAINKRFGQGVTLENNGFVPWLRVVGAQRMLPANHTAVLATLGVKESQVAGKSWESSADRTARHAAGEAVAAQLPLAGKAIWKEADLPEVAAFLKDQAALLALAEEASRKPRWFCPLIAEPEGFAEAPRFAGVSDILRAIAARSMLRAGASDFVGFRADVDTLLRLGDHFGNSPWLIERLLAVVAQADAAGAIDGAAAANAFTREQWKQLSGDVEQAADIDLAEAIGVTERFARLSVVTRMATARQANAAVNDDPVIKRLAAIDRAAVDWDLVLEGINEQYDTLLIVMRMAPGPQRDAAEAALQAHRQAAAKIAQGAPASSPNQRTSNARWFLAALEAIGMSPPGAMTGRVDAAKQSRAHMLEVVTARAAEKRPEAAPK
jgi:hypothetical protein